MLSINIKQVPAFKAYFKLSEQRILIRCSGMVCGFLEISWESSAENAHCCPMICHTFQTCFHHLEWWAVVPSLGNHSTALSLFQRALLKARGLTCLTFRTALFFHKNLSWKQNKKIKGTIFFRLMKLLEAMFLTTMLWKQTFSPRWQLALCKAFYCFSLLSFPSLPRHFLLSNHFQT